MKLSDKAEEILEALWIVVEEKGHGYAELEKIKVMADDPAYPELAELAFIEVKEGRVYLTPGRKGGGAQDSPPPPAGRAAHDGRPQHPRGDRQ